MTDKLTILCPITSRGCSAELSEQPVNHALFPSMDRLGLWDDVRLFLGYDDDDPIWGQQRIRYDIRRRVHWQPLTGLTGNITAIWNILDAASGDWEFLLPANDDLSFLTSPLPAIDVLKERGGFGIVGFYDHAFPGLTTFFVVGSIHREIFGSIYPVPWFGAHQDSWIADVYRPWGASEVDERFVVHNRIGSESSPVTASRFDYGEAPNYRAAVIMGRRKVNAWLEQHPIADVLPEEELRGERTIIA